MSSDENMLQQAMDYESAISMYNKLWSILPPEQKDGILQAIADGDYTWYTHMEKLGDRKLLTMLKSLYSLIRSHREERKKMPETEKLSGISDETMNEIRQRISWVNTNAQYERWTVIAHGTHVKPHVIEIPYRHHPDRTYPEWQISVSPFWEKQVKSRNLHRGMDVGGRDAFVLGCRPCKKQPFLDENIELLDAKMITMHMSYPKDGTEYRKLDVQYHDRFIAIETCNVTGKRFVATGTTPNWARRTLNGRNKKQLLTKLLGDM